MVEKVTLYLVADKREDFQHFGNANDVRHFNDHPSEKAIMNFYNAIDRNLYNPILIGGVKELINIVQRDENKYRDTLVINLSDGLSQTSRRAQAPLLFEMLNMKASGSATFTIMLLNNKFYTKMALKNFGILTPEAILVTIKTIDSMDLNNIGFPCIVKPNNEGSSIGIINGENVCNCMDELYYQSNKLLSSFDEIIIEKYVPGFEITHLIIGNKGDIRISDIILYRMKDKEYFTSEVMGVDEKKNKKRQYVLAEAMFDSELISKIKQTSIKIIESLNIQDMTRIDYRINKEDGIFFIEANSNPSFSLTSEVGFLCEAKDISFGYIVNQYIDAFITRVN